MKLLEKHHLLSSKLKELIVIFKDTKSIAFSSAISVLGVGGVATMLCAMACVGTKVTLAAFAVEALTGLGITVGAIYLSALIGAAGAVGTALAASACMKIWYNRRCEVQLHTKAQSEVQEMEISTADLSSKLSLLKESVHEGRLHLDNFERGLNAFNKIWTQVKTLKVMCCQHSSVFGNQQRGTMTLQRSEIVS